MAKSKVYTASHLERSTCAGSDRSDDLENLCFYPVEKCSRLFRLGSEDDTIKLGLTVIHDNTTIMGARYRRYRHAKMQQEGNEPAF